MMIVYSLRSSSIRSSIARGGDRVERRARLVHQDHVGLGGDGAGDAEPLLLAAGEAVGRLLELVLDLVPECGAAQRLLDEVVHVVDLHAGDPRAVGDVVVDRLRERVGLLEDHADVACAPRSGRRPCRRCPGRGSVTSPSTRAPGTRSFIRFRQRSTVDLPQPDGPISAVISLRAEGQVDVVHGVEVAVVDVEVRASITGRVDVGDVRRGARSSARPGCRRANPICGDACREVVAAPCRQSPHQDRWNLLRMKMARALSPRIMTSSTMMAAEAACWSSSCDCEVSE